LDNQNVWVFSRCVENDYQEEILRAKPVFAPPQKRKNEASEASHEKRKNEASEASHGIGPCTLFNTGGQVQIVYDDDYRRHQ
jgi:hypothetical protein